MPLSYTNVSPDLCRRFNLAAQVDAHHPFTYSEFLLHTSKDAAFFKRAHSDRGEVFAEYFMAIGQHLFRVIPREKRATQKGQRIPPSFELHFISYISFSNELKIKAQRIAREINLTHVGIEEGKLLRRLFIDNTTPTKPRSISRLRKMLNKLAHKTDKSIFINSMEAFVPFVLSAEEANIVHADVRTSYGKYLSEKALLIFELGYEKCKSKISSSEQDVSCLRSTA